MRQKYESVEAVGGVHSSATATSTVPSNHMEYALPQKGAISADIFKHPYPGKSSRYLNTNIQSFRKLMKILKFITSMFSKQCTNINARKDWVAYWLFNFHKSSWTLPYLEMWVKYFVEELLHFINAITFYNSKHIVFLNLFILVKNRFLEILGICRGQTESWLVFLESGQSPSRRGVGSFQERCVLIYRGYCTKSPGPQTIP